MKPSVSAPATMFNPALAMNSEDQSSSLRKQSAQLLIAYIAALAGIAVWLHVLITIVSKALGQGGSLWEPSASAVAVIGLVWFTMIAGSIFRWADVRAGGAVLAERYGATPISNNAKNEKEQRLVNVVAAVSISSARPQPDIYVLLNESCANAFVLGQTSKLVIVVTKGALECLNRDQLHAVVAHRFGQISNGDSPFNMRLVIALSGLLSINKMGHMLRANGENRLNKPSTIIGYMLCAFGSLGVLSGRAITALFARKRVLLADAAALHLTGNPFALASALDMLREQGGNNKIKGIHTHELAHLCFHTHTALPGLRIIFGTHPDINARIQTIDPKFSEKKSSQAAALTEASYAAVVTHMPMLASNEDVNSKSDVEHVRGAPLPLKAPKLSDRIVLLLADDASCLAALFALFVHNNEQQKREYLAALAFSFGKPFVELVKKAVKQLPDELANDQFCLIVHVSKNINLKMSLKQRQQIALKLENLLRVNGDYRLMDYVRLQLVRRSLGLGFPVVEKIADSENSIASARKVKRFDAMGQEFALLLSLMVESSGVPEQALDAQFQRVLKCYTRDNYVRRSANEAGIVQELETAFQTLYVQPKEIRHAFVQHCTEIMRHDGRIAVSERGLLDLFAASLGCDELIAA